MTAVALAPEWRIAQWLNTPDPLTVAALRGRVILVLAFQMLCPGCVSQALPQAQRARVAFAPQDLAVVGLHTVFEHHEAQGGREALAAFLHEYRIGFPVGLDAQAEGLPQTMAAYRMQGTPTLMLIDRAGRLRLQHFGHLDDLRLGAAIQALIGEAAPATGPQPAAAAQACDDAGCPVPDDVPRD
jgi:hypothetical protein